jgi:hypothetical protein
MGCVGRRITPSTRFTAREAAFRRVMGTDDIRPHAAAIDVQRSCAVSQDVCGNGADQWFSEEYPVLDCGFEAGSPSGPLFRLICLGIVRW